MSDPVAFYRKPLDEQTKILEEEAEALAAEVKSLWEATGDRRAYEVWRQACDFYTLTFQHRVFIGEELFSE